MNSEIEQGSMDGSSWIQLVEARFRGKETISFGDLAKTGGDRAYGFLLIAMALPGFIPGLSSLIGPLLGAALIMVGIQLHRGRTGLWLPKRLQAMTIQRGLAIRLLTRIDDFFTGWNRRLTWFDRPLPMGWIGSGVIWAGLVLGSPLGLVPMSNAAPALSICLLGISILDDKPSFAWIGLALLLLYTLLVFLLLALYWNVLIGPSLAWITSLQSRH